MPKVFLSHSSKDKKIVLKIQQSLNNSFIDTWICDDQIGGGQKLEEMVSAGIKNSSYIFIFLSNNYITSPWCIEELEQAHKLKEKEKAILVPILLIPRSDLKIKELPVKRKHFFESLLEEIKYVELDIYKENESIKYLLDELWKSEPIKFEPMRVVEANGTNVILVNISILLKHLPNNFLEKWNVDLESFISKHSNDSLPILLNGATIGWLVTYLTIPFKNKKSVYVFNTGAEGYICVYSLNNKNPIGDVIPALYIDNVISKEYISSAA